MQELKKRASDLDYKVTELDNASREAKRLKLQNEAEKKRADAAIAGETKANLAREEAEKAKAALELEKQQAEAARKEQAERARSAGLGDLDLATWKLDKILGRVNFSCQHFSSFKPGCERVLQVRGPGTAPQSREAACQGKDTRGATGAQCAAPRAPGDRPRPRPIFPLIFFPKEVHACETGHCAPIQDGLQNIADSPAAGLSHRHTCSC